MIAYSTTKLAHFQDEKKKMPSADAIQERVPLVPRPFHTWASVSAMSLRVVQGDEGLRCQIGDAESKRNVENVYRSKLPPRSFAAEAISQPITLFVSTKVVLQVLKCILSLL
jgi:hypothetical protein